MMENTRKLYVPEVEFEQLAKDMIANLNGDRLSDYFVLARGLSDKDAEVSVSLIEEKSELDPGEAHYTIPLIDGVNGDGESMIYHTQGLSEKSLIRLLQNIWTELTNADGQCGPAPEYVDKAAEFNYLKSYIMGACLDDETSVTFLYALWVAYCLHQNICIDSIDCEVALMELWKALEESDGGEVSHWEDFFAFREDMCRDLR